MKNITAGTIIRTVCLLLALINQGLTMAGLSPLPIDDKQVTDMLSLAFTIAASVWAWWKNNSYTQPAIIADEIMHDLKAGAALELELVELDTEDAAEDDVELD